MMRARCDTCGNEYDKAFQVTMEGSVHRFDSFECAIEKLAPRCSHHLHPGNNKPSRCSRRSFSLRPLRQCRHRRSRSPRSCKSRHRLRLQTQLPS